MRRVVVTGMGAITPIGDECRKYSGKESMPDRLDLVLSRSLMQVNIKHILRQKSKVLSEKSIWILRQQSVWNCLHSTQ